jgi:hypothetical protein
VDCVLTAAATIASSLFISSTIWSEERLSIVPDAVLRASVEADGGRGTCMKKGISLKELACFKNSKGIDLWKTACS